MNTYDIIIVGSGIGGLTCAALLAKAGKSVLVLEAHDRPGGYAHGFKRKKYQFDGGVHLVSGCGPTGYQGGQVIYKLLQALGVGDELEFINADPFSHVYYPGFASALPQSVAAFVNTLAKHYPLQRQGLANLVRLCLQVTEEIALASEMALTDYDTASRLVPALCQYRKSTLAEVMAEYIDDPQLCSVFASNWPYLGLPPSKLSFIYWAAMLMGYMADGSYYCKGGFQNFADALVKGIRQHGGTVRLRSPVGKIIIEDKQVAGVMVNDTRFDAPVVVANADMRQTVFDLVGERHFPERYVQKINKMQHSVSIFVVYIATDLDLVQLNMAHESFYYRDFDHDRNFAQTLNGKVDWIGITVPTLLDPGLAPAGEHLLVLTALLPYSVKDSWQEAKQGYMDSIVDIAADYIPNLKQHINFIEGGSPATLHRYTQNYQGAAYGWDVIPCQIDPVRIRNASPVAGLYFAGHWCSPGSGIYGVSISGMQAAQHILGIKRPSELWQALL
ncbi:phytoene desaturase family protein [Methylovulum psychrotolerans]|uniref:Phytoene desaturase n=1 Tax=Methylovulum psychrotolerans TaxID=1704499 RepID=A0A2S5CGX4_9GAMM|nr:NAD(P)/FAD-dependent oxidoreductase [Methylovulum psychrotolerans]POZ50060.1 phytoene desaturase [Methylovulum psychrotolerans]